MSRKNFNINERVVFVLGCSSRNFYNNSRYNINAHKGDKGTILESNSVSTKILLDNDQYLRIPTESINYYLIPDLSLLNSLDEARQDSPEKKRVSRQMGKVGMSLEKLAKLIDREWNPIQKRKLEKDLDKEIKNLLNLKQLIKGTEWEK